MAMFPVNQNVQFFTPTTAEIAELKKTANTSTLLKKNGGKVFFTATSGKYQHTTDPITVKNGGFIKYVIEADMEHTLKGITITYDSTNFATPSLGEVYGIYINQRNYHALGDNEFMELGAEVRYGSKFNFETEGVFDTSTAYGIGDVVTYATDGKTYIFKAAHSAGAWNTSHVDVVPEGGLTVNSVAYLMKALAQAFERNLGTDSDLYTVTVTSTATTAGVITIMEKEQSWLQGLEQNEHVSLTPQDAFLSTITVNTMEHNDWATIASTTGSSLKNSKDIADMEWFYLGEHGDQQRLMGYPYANRATISGEIYNIKANNSTGYDLIYIHHAYVGNGTFVQKSEKDIMIAVPADADSNAGGLNIAKAIEAALTGESATLTSAGGMVTF